MEDRIPIKTISTREVYRNPWCSVREDIIERIDPAGGPAIPGIYGVMDKQPSSIIVPLEHTPEGDFLWLVHQYRYTVGGHYFEFPQGSWELAEVDPEDLARGELAEETGLRANRMTRLGGLWIAYGAMRQIHHTYLAEGLTPGTTERDPEELDMTVHRVPVAEFESMLLDGRVMDNCTVAAWGLYLVWRAKHPASGPTARLIPA
jgi:8-oxo-dGTP pyrophosphatase MutT (NUDIX family)